MRGLLLAHEKDPEKCDEAYVLCKEAIKLDLKNHMCWHVFGLLYKLDRNYKEAIKCYATALKFAPENQQIMRDLSLLQIMVRA